jgi:hypothetical protein
VDAAESNDHFERMELHETIERSRDLIAKYLDGMAHQHRKIEKSQHQLGRLDERLNK